MIFLHMHRLHCEVFKILLKVTVIITRWLYCAECPQYSIRLKAPGYTSASCLLPAFGLELRDSIVDRHWLPAIDYRERYLPCCKPAFDVEKMWGRLLVRSVQAMEMTFEFIPTVKIDIRHP